MKIQLPKDRASLEHLIDAAIARLDELDGDPDFEPTMGAPNARGTPCVDVGRWMADHLDRRPGDLPPELTRRNELSQAHWAEGTALDECEQVSEDEGAITGDDEPDCDDEPDVDREPSLGSQEGTNQTMWGVERAPIDYEEESHKDEHLIADARKRYRARQGQSATTPATMCMDAAQRLREVQRKHGKPLSPPPRVIAGAIFRF